MTDRPGTALKLREILLLAGSVALLYTLPRMYNQLLLVGIAFGLIQVFAVSWSRIRGEGLRAVCYVAVSAATYHLLFWDRPWDLLFGGLPENPTFLPVFFCSIIMSLAGARLLLWDTRHRKAYLWLTLAVQLPLSLLFGTELIGGVFKLLARFLFYIDEYAGGMQAWQLVWLLNYYLPIYFFARNREFGLEV